MKTHDKPILKDEELLARAQNGDIRAFHTLFAQFQPQLKSYLYRLLANRNSMEDMATMFLLPHSKMSRHFGERPPLSLGFLLSRPIGRVGISKTKSVG